MVARPVIDFAAMLYEVSSRPVCSSREPVVVNMIWHIVERIQLGYAVFIAGQNLSYSIYYVNSDLNFLILYNDIHILSGF